MHDNVLVAQLTDLHLGPGNDPMCGENERRFRECLQAIGSNLRLPDLFLVTGDIAERGDRESYALFAQIMEETGSPWICLPGNHDNAEALAEVARDACVAPSGEAGSWELGNWRIVTADTSFEGEHGGFFDEARSENLNDVLAQDTSRPVLLAVHHPPVPIGLEWIDPEPDAPWIARLAEVLAQHDHVARIVCGHVHLPSVSTLGRIPVVTAPSTAPLGWPDFAPFDTARKDGRVLIADGVPGFAWHRLHSGGVDTVFGQASKGTVRLAH